MKNIYTNFIRKQNKLHKIKERGLRMNKCLVVVDMQNDFIDGVLGSPEAQAIVDNVCKKIREYKSNDDLIITTQDTHYSDYLNTPEGVKLPVIHCIANSDGWQLNDRVFNDLKNYKNKINFTKITFGCNKLIDYLKTIINEDNENYFEIEVIGLVLDICVISNVILLKNYFPNINISVDTKCTAATSESAFNSAKIVLQSCQVDVNE